MTGILSDLFGAFQGGLGGDPGLGLPSPGQVGPVQPTLTERIGAGVGGRVRRSGEEFRALSQQPGFENASIDRDWET